MTGKIKAANTSENVEIRRKKSNEARRGASGNWEPSLNKITDSNTPIPPGAAGTIRPITQARENADNNSPFDINDPIEKAFIQHKKPRNLDKINIVSTNNDLYG